MKRYLISTLILVAYSIILVKVMVFKDIPTIHIGSLMLNFGGTDAGHSANFIPFKTIVPYLLGYKGWIIAGINLVGNIILLVPIGFLAPLVYKNISWKRTLILAVAAGLIIEVMQVLLHVGIFDIDDVILNALGVMIGYWVFEVFSKWIKERKYRNIIITTILVVAIMATLYGTVIYPMIHQPMNLNNQKGLVSATGDLCGGTGGAGQITSIGNNTFTIKRKDNKDQIVNPGNRATIKDQTGSISISDLNIGDRVTLVGGPNSDGSFTADTILVCNELNS